MLNEGFTLYKSLERCGISPPKRYPDIKKVGKKKGLIIGIDAQGKVTSIEFRNAEEMSKLWKISNGLKNSFPCMTLSLGLLNLDAFYKNEEGLITNKTSYKELKEIWQKYGLNLKFKKKNGKESKQSMIADWQSTIKKLKERRDDVENLRKEAIAYKELLDRMLRYDYEDSNRDIVNDITEQIFLNLEKGLLSYEDVKDYLVSEEPGAFIFFDISDYTNIEKYETRVASSSIVDYISDCLLEKLKTKVVNIEVKNNHYSALSGKTNIEIVDKFPDPNLKIVGITQLFGVDRNTPCLRRYGQISTKIFPVSAEEANSIQDSLVWATDENRRGKTWYSVPGSNNSESDLLIVYIENKPDLNTNKAHLLGGVSKNDFSESTYEAIASIAIKALKAEEVKKANDLIRLFVIHKADKMRRQISLQRIYTIANLLNADKNWRDSANNIPNVQIPFFRNEVEKNISKQEELSITIKKFLSDEKLKVFNYTPNCPFPADLVRLTQKQWIRDGEDFSSVTGSSLGDIYEVFFDHENNKKVLTETLLNKTLRCTQTLLISFGAEDHKKSLGNNIKKFTREKRFTILRTVSVLAIYLYKLGIKKENYMKDTLFNIGRFLSLLDTLHYEYCNNVRGGNIPPQLLGNAHLQIALDNPVTAIDMLGRRVSVYRAWAVKEKGKKAKLAKWTIGEIGKITDMLGEKGLPSSTSSADRAQILLGYLARPEEKADSASVSNP